MPRLLSLLRSIFGYGLGLVLVAAIVAGFFSFGCGSEQIEEQDLCRYLDLTTGGTLIPLGDGFERGIGKVSRNLVHIIGDRWINGTTGLEYPYYGSPITIRYVKLAYENEIPLAGNGSGPLRKKCSFKELAPDPRLVFPQLPPGTTAMTLVSERQNYLQEFLYQHPDQCPNFSYGLFDSKSCDLAGEKAIEPKTTKPELDNKPRNESIEVELQLKRKCTFQDKYFPFSLSRNFLACE